MYERQLRVCMYGKRYVRSIRFVHHTAHHCRRHRRPSGPTNNKTKPKTLSLCECVICRLLLPLSNTECEMLCRHRHRCCRRANVCAIPALPFRTPYFFDFYSRLLLFAIALTRHSIANCRLGIDA